VASLRFRGNIRAVTTKLKRRLTTVLCADVHGYSRLMEADESGTFADLRRCRTAIAMLVARHEGRIVNTWGDAVIAEFASVVEAVQCAVEIQQELSNPPQESGEDQRMRFRIGINLGDVMVEGTDLYGEGVNIAARLQELAEPGGILISGPVYDQVHRKLAVGFEFLGHQQVKNVTQAVVGYRVTLLRRPTARRGRTRESGAVAIRARSAGRDHQSLGAVHEPPSPDRRDVGDLGFSLSNQCVQRVSQRLVSLARRVAAADRPPVGRASSRPPLGRPTSRAGLSDERGALANTSAGVTRDLEPARR
jgi:class 3 adenylate cyclase